MSHHRFAVVLIIALCQPCLARAQERLFAAAGGTLHEVSSNPNQLGRVLRSWPLPAEHGYLYELFTFDRGKKIGWASVVDSMLYLHVFDIATETFARTPIAPSWYASAGLLAGVADGRDSLIFITQDVTGATADRTVLQWHWPTRRIVQSVELRGTCHFDYAYAAAAHLLFARRASRCLFSVPDAQWIDVVDLETGGVRERAFDVPYGSFQTIATNPSGTRLWVSTMLEAFAAPASLGVFDTETGQLLNVNRAVYPERRRYPAFLQYVDPGVVMLVTASGLTGVRADSLQPIATADAPRLRLNPSQIPPGYAPQLGYQILTHPAGRAVVAYEWAAITYSYHGGPCLQSALMLLEPSSGERIATRDLAELFGGPVCGAKLALAVDAP